MLQFVAVPSDIYSIAEQAQMAIEGGVKWVIFNPMDWPDDAVRESLSELVPLCKETDTILTIIDHAEAARDMKIHGVQLSSAANATRLREELGPEAIIGVAVGGADGVEALRGKDMDYFVLPANASLADLTKITTEVRERGDRSALVACGNYSLDELDVVMATGVSGLQLSQTIVSAPDPVEAARKALFEILK